MAVLRPDRHVPTGLDPYLLKGEKVVAAVHYHWAKMVRPVAETLLAFIVAIVVDTTLTPKTRGIGPIVWIAFMFMVARLIWKVLEWRHDWFVATDKRLLLRTNLITNKVSMMPLFKVTDMSYTRSIPGQILGYGQFIMESAGQDQALREVNWVPRPDDTYRAICSQMFPIADPPEVDEDALDEDLDGPESFGNYRDPGDYGDHDGYDDDGAPHELAHRGVNLHEEDYGPVSSGRRRWGGSDDPIQQRNESYSRAVPVTPGESVFESEDRRKRRRGADTGPIPLDWRDRKGGPRPISE